MTVTRGTTNRNARGGSPQRRARKAWLLATFDLDLGPDLARCHLGVSPKCLGTVTLETVSADRYPIPGVDGGTYRRGNIQPACEPCQSVDGANLRWARAKAKAVAQ